MTATVRSRDRSRGVVAVVVGDVSYGEVGQAEELDVGTEFCFGEHEAAQVPMELVDGERRPGLSRASELCPVADSGSARSWPSELPGGGQVFCPGFSWPGA